MPSQRRRWARFQRGSIVTSDESLFADHADDGEIQRNRSWQPAADARPQRRPRHPDAIQWGRRWTRARRRWSRGWWIPRRSSRSRGRSLIRNHLLAGQLAGDGARGAVANGIRAENGVVPGVNFGDGVRVEVGGEDLAAVGLESEMRGGFADIKEAEQVVMLQRGVFSGRYHEVGVAASQRSII